MAVALDFRIHDSPVSLTVGVGDGLLVGGVPCGVRHELQPVGAVELGLRWKF
jgi:hypothetical protein